MRKRHFILFAGMALLLAGVLAWAFSRSREPEFEGKTVHGWLRGYPGALTETSQMETENALDQIGTNAIPTLLGMLRVRDSAAKSWFIALAEKQHFFRVDSEPADAVHSEAAVAFGRLGPKAVNALPELIAIYQHDTSKSARTSAACALGAIGPEAKEAVPALLESLAESSYWIRLAAVMALGKIRSEPDQVVPELIKLLNEPQHTSGLRAAALESLGNYGPDARASVPAITQLLDDPSHDDRLWAFLALQKIDPQAAAKVPREKIYGK